MTKNLVVKVKVGPRPPFKSIKMPLIPKITTIGILVTKKIKNKKILIYQFNLNSRELTVLRLIRILKNKSYD